MLTNRISKQQNSNSLFRRNAMEPLIDVKASRTECTSLSSAPIWQDILAQAMTGELLAAMNYASLSEICNDPEEVADALEHAEGESGHAASFAAEGRKVGVDVTNNVDAKHWKRLREAFLRCIAERDFIACLIVPGNHAGILRGRKLFARRQ